MLLASLGGWSWKENHDALQRFDGSFTASVNGRAPVALATLDRLRTDGVTRARFIGGNGTPVPLVSRDDVVLTHRVGELCREDCRRPRCGDGQLDGGERCDDGNTSGGDGCSPDCQRFN